METIQDAITKYKQLLAILCGAFIGSTIIINLAACFFVMLKSRFFIYDPTTALIIKLVAIATLLVDLPLAWYIHSSRMKKLVTHATLGEKLSEYYKSLILKYSLIMGFGIFGGVVAIITNDIYMIFVGILAIGAMIASWPSTERMNSEMRLNSQEIDFMRNK